jgi:ABC-type thiamin/hydroxymethylpyrimidine transport system permease subunit
LVKNFKKESEMMKFSTRQLVTLAVFGALWGAVEMSLGSVIKALNLPLSGAILAGIGMLIVLIGRVFIPQRGSTLFIGVIAMVLKLFSIGSIIIGPMMGILAEAILAEIVLSGFGKPSRLSFILAGAAAVTWTLVQPFFTGWLLFGRDMFIVWLDLLDQGARLFGLNVEAAGLIVLVLLGIHLAIGGAAGWLAWSSAYRLQARLNRAPVTPTEESTRS